ncbi:hypothetical protein D3C85_501940 [compost metagenome]
MSDKLRGGTTISTEHRTYLTDAISKKSLARATVSARSSKIEQRDVEVTQTQPYIITRHSNKFLQISTTFPVIATFIPGVPELDVPEVPNSTYTTGIIYADATLEAGDPILVSLYDPDISAATAQVTVFNATTGETEFLTLTRLDNGLYRGELRTFLCRYKGEDFDGLMNNQPTDTIRIIYNDGRGSNGEPVAVTHQATVISSAPVPSLFVRRAAPVYGAVNVSLQGLPVGSAPTVSITDTLSGQKVYRTLNEFDGEYATAFIPEVVFPAIVVGDVLLIEYAYPDIFGDVTTITQRCVMGTGETEGVLTAPATVQRGGEIVLKLDDPDVDVPYIDLVVSGNQSNQFTRWRALRLATGSGLYSYTALVPALFDNDQALTVTYADSSAGTPKLVQRVIAITDVAAPTPGPVVVPEEPEANTVEQLALQMEINGLFTLNGRFSGIVKLRAVHNETVRCSIVQAS